MSIQEASILHSASYMVRYSVNYRALRVHNLCKSIFQIHYTVGDSFNSSLVAIAAVDPEEVLKWAKSRGMKVLSLQCFKDMHMHLFFSISG